MNKTELTKRKIKNYNFEFEDGNLVGISFMTSHTIKKLHSLFPDARMLYECFDEDNGSCKCYIMYKLSSNFKQVSSITYVITEWDIDYDREYRIEVNGYDIFNDEEISLIKNEVKRIFDNLLCLMYSVDLRKCEIGKNGLKIKF